MSVSYEKKEKYSIDDLLRIMEILRSEEGCPWDREQTHPSMRRDMIEEAYEVCEAIDLNDTDLLKEELGDVLLQVVHHARIEQEQGSFDFQDVCDGICRKLIQRHPHVFADVQVDGTEQVLNNWEQIKQQSKGQTTGAQTLLSVPKTFPALMRAQKVQKRAAKTGFEYPDLFWAMDDLESELDELQAAIDEEDPQQCFEELGDVLFSAVNIARFLKVDAEDSLNASTEKFINRFCKVEQLAQQLGITDTVVVTGKVLHPDLPPYVHTCDIYVTASLSDTNSISMLEGMAGGLPVLQLYDELNADQVTDGVNGYMFRDAAEMGQRLRQIRDMEPEELQKLKTSVIQSVKNSGAQTLANYIQTIYYNIYQKQPPKKPPLFHLPSSLTALARRK